MDACLPDDKFHSSAEGKDDSKDRQCLLVRVTDFQLKKVRKERSIFNKRILERNLANLRKHHLLGQEPAQRQGNVQAREELRIHTFYAYDANTRIHIFCFLFHLYLPFHFSKMQKTEQHSAAEAGNIIDHAINLKSQILRGAFWIN